MNSIDFSEIAPVWLILSIALVTGAYLIHKEIKRNSKTKLLRIAALIILLGSLTGLALKPSFRMKQPVYPRILLTKGFDSKIVDSLHIAYPNAIIERLTPSLAYEKSEVITSVGDFAQNDGAVNFVLGEGLSPTVLDLFPGIHFKYFPSKKPLGITELTSERALVNHTNHVSGKINHNKGSVLKFIGPGGEADSIQLKQNGEIPFLFSFTPRQTGAFVYQFTIRDSLGQMQTDNLPLEIFPERKLDILAILRHPTFEIRYLKNFLTEKGHGAVLRYQVSKNKFRYEYVNHNSAKVDQLSSDLIDDFDLLCISASDLETLSEQEITILKIATRSGLGLIILFDQLSENKSLNQFLGAEFVKTNRDTLSVTFQTAEKQTLSVLPVQFKTSGNFETLLQSSDHQLLTGYRFEGLGKIGVQLLKDTYTLQLRGNQTAYGEIWTPLLEQTAREESNRYKINILTPSPLYPDNPIDFEIISSGDVPEVFVDSIRVPLVEDVVVDDYWHGRTLSASPGWHDIQIKQDSTVKTFFVDKQESWTSKSLNAQMQANRLRDYADYLPANKTKDVFKQISVWILFTLILIGFGYLWLEPRI